jgi:FtsP/CotA-like multicopper oxidase with cupredoxin domain
MRHARFDPAVRTIAVLLALSGAAMAGERPFAQPPGLVESTKAPLKGAAGPQLRALFPAPVTGCAPKAFVSRKGSIVHLKLHLVRGQFAMYNPDPSDPHPNHMDPVELRSYGGCEAGPVVNVDPGTTLRVDLINDLSANDPSCGATPQPPVGTPSVGCFNTTNLHTHGLHVSPAGNGDNVLLNIMPQTHFPYEINIPFDHPAGTFWYHSHRHGSTAMQVASGESGALIIRGHRPYAPPTAEDPHPIADIDTILRTSPKGRATSEKVFLFQQIAYACFANGAKKPAEDWSAIYTAKGMYKQQGGDPGADSAAWLCPLSTEAKPVSVGAVENFELQLDSPTIWDTNGRFTSINGVVQPTLTLRAGEIERWRFIHAGIHDTINLQIVRAGNVRSQNLIGLSALVGNRQAQIEDVRAACTATRETLIPQFEIASDGLTRPRIHVIKDKLYTDPKGNRNYESNYLQPGYRSDILVVFPVDGDYCLLNQAAPSSERVSNGGGGQGPSEPQLLAYVHVRGGHAVRTDLRTYVEKSLYDNNPQLPPAVRTALGQGDISPWAPFTELPPATTTQTTTNANFSIELDGNNVKFLINNSSYDPGVVNVTREVNSTDDWLLTSESKTLRSEPHIYHIHVNPFEVMDVTTTDTSGKTVSIFNSDGSCNAELMRNDAHALADQYCGMYHTFRDTIFVENGYQVHIRTKYERYIGEFVMHCHILDHEDQGMMINVAIVPDIHAPGGGLGMPDMKASVTPSTPKPNP